LNNSGTIESYIDNYFQTLTGGVGGSVNFQSGSHFVNYATITNNGPLTNNRTLTNNGTLTFANGSTFDNTDGTLNNSGTIESHIDDRYFGAGGTLNFQSGSNYVNHATITNNAGSTLTNAHTLTNDGTLNNNLRGTLANKGTLTNNGTLNNDFTLNNRGRLTNDGTLNNHNTLNNYGTLANQGTLNNWYNISNNNTLTNQGTLTNNDGFLSNSGTLVNQGTLTNDGRLKNRKDGTLTNDGTLENRQDGTLTNDGTIDTTNGTFTNYGTKTGSGRIEGSYIDHGHTRPGNSAGVMTINGDYFKVGGSKEIELGGHFHGDGDKSLTEFDWLDVTGNVELAGTLDVKLIDGFKLHRGNVFNFLRVGGTLTGQYDGLGEGDLVRNFGGQGLFITYGGGDGNDVALYTVPEPATLLLALLAMTAVPLRVRCG